MTDLRALTLIRPMSAAIVHGSKRIENRPVNLPKAMRGVETVVAVHAGKGWDERYWETCMNIDGIPSYAERTADEGIVGLMLLSGRVFKPTIPGQYTQLLSHDCHAPSDPWFSGPYGYEILSAVAFPQPIACRGMLGFWRVPADIVEVIEASGFIQKLKEAP